MYDHIQYGIINKDNPEVYTKDYFYPMHSEFYKGDTVKLIGLYENDYYTYYFIIEGINKSPVYDSVFIEIKNIK
jgi:hypothetical protein